MLFADEDHSVTVLNTTFTTTNASIASFQRMNTSTIGVYTGSTEGSATLTVRATDPDGLQSGTLSLVVNVKARNFTGVTSNTAGSYYADGVPARKWILFSVPGQLQNTITTEIFKNLTGKQPFKLYSLNSNGTLDELPEQGSLNFAQGYWFKTIAKKSNFDIESTPGQRYTARTYTAFFGTSWRFIGSPYDVPVNWNFTSTSGVRRLWRFDAEAQTWVEMNTTRQIQPWTGYLLYTTSNVGLTLTIPNGVASAAKIAVEKQPEPTWAYTLAIGSSTLRLGEMEGAEDGEDQGDMPLLPSAPEAEKPVAYFAVDHRPFTADFRGIEHNPAVAAQRIHKVWIAAGRHEITADAEGLVGDRQLLLHGDGVYVRFNPGATKSVKIPESGWYAVQTGSPEMLDRYALPQQASLMDAYPNPFNPSTTLRFALPKEAAVKLEVFDLNGRRVFLAADRPFAAGFHTVAFDASNLASGTYLYRLSVDGKSISTKKMTLLK
jgi:hypothetical protein